MTQKLHILVFSLVLMFAFTGCEKDSASSGTTKGGLTTLFGTDLIDRDKTKVQVSEMAGKKVGIYFSAHWCPPCRAFTPHLVNVYNEIKKQGNPFEIVFVSSDRDEKHMLDYMREMKMPWLAIPFGDGRVGKLKSKFGIRGIPSLVIVDAQGNTITKDGRGDVGRKGAAAYKAW